MTLQHTLMRDVLLWLQDRCGTWERNPSGPASRFHDRVRESYLGFSGIELEGLLTNRVEFDSSEQNRYLFLEPINEGRGIVPVLSFRYDFRGENAELRLRLALFVPHDNALAAIGCRFEPPEGPGDHDYYHAQMCRAFQKGGKELPCCPPWLPESWPAFHLKADDPVTLLICMVISLYGLRLAGELQQEPFANVLKHSMQKLCPTVAVKGNQTVAAGPINRRGRRRRG